MSDIGPISQSRATAATSFTRTQRAGQIAGSTARGSDRVEFSNHAQWLSRIASLPPVRQDLINRVRGEIESGQYMSDEKIDIALSRLSEDI